MGAAAADAATSGAELTLNELKEQVGRELGVSRWIVVDQARIDAFAAVSGDHQFIHVDPVRAAQTPFGGTIAHGLLTLSLMGEMGHMFPRIAGQTMGVNYGFDRIRFLAPVPSGSAIRARCTLAELSERSPGNWLFRYLITVEIKDRSQPAMVADWLILNAITDSAAA
ncbi:MaoC family dehydratase [Chelatococcus reniformis]|uniref:Dehydratase n=1 Tax=Chelatococcus reniformis TaxID=1494448 RepID=A0A916TXK2_9HYPH|nr:MaoC family dehydratase [Chelatococcus reniformis]GGC47801.1 dehydratase [Chelatococcus reniformis]